jgi:peptidoglycan/LPS O-acetylase OafA/YrhL
MHLERSTASSGYIPGIDGLRAIAVVSVILFHLQNTLLPGGFVGVDIFFVISGFVVTGSLKGRKFTTFFELLSFFYARRLLRIMPALIVMLLISILLTNLFVPKTWLSSAVPQTGIGAFFGVSNIVLALQSDGYFAARTAFNPFVHTWSLGVEEQFYLIFPFLMYWHGQSLDNAKSTQRVIRTIAILLGISLAVCAVLGAQNWKYSFYLIPSRFWELGVGMLLSLTTDKWASWAQRERTPLSIVGAILIAISFAVPETIYFPFPLALIPSMGAAALIMVVVANRDGVASNFLSCSPMVGAGKLSYSLYLWHWPIFVLFRWTVGLLSPTNKSAAIFLVFICGALSYYLVEQNTRRNPSIVKLPGRRIIALVLTITVLTALSGKVLFANSDRTALSATGNHDAWYADEAKTLIPRFTHCAVTSTSRKLADGSVTTWQGRDCNRSASNIRIFAVGDSHNLGYLPIYRQFAADTGGEVRVYFKSGCAFLPLSSSIADKANCRAFIGATMKDLGAELRANDVLFMPSLRLTRLVRQDDGPETTVPPKAIDRANGLAEANNALMRLEATGASFVFEAPKPLFKISPFRCSDWFNRNNPSCSAGMTVSRQFLLSRRETVVRSMSILQHSWPRLTIWDPFPILCPVEPCSAVHIDGPLFFDSNHLTGHGNDVLYPSFRAHIAQTTKEIASTS